MSGFISMIESQLSFSANEAHEGTVVMRGRREYMNIFGILIRLPVTTANTHQAGR